MSHLHLPRRWPGAAALSRRGAILAAALIMPAVVALIWAAWPVTDLEIRSGAEGRLLRSLPVSSGERITYTYLHSVQKRPVVEELEIASNGSLVVVEATFDMAGAGQPSDVLDGDLVIDREAGTWRIANMSRAIPDWHVRVAFTAQQTLKVGGETFRLDSLVAPTSLLTINVVSRPHVLALLDSTEAGLSRLGQSASGTRP